MPTFRSRSVFRSSPPESTSHLSLPPLKLPLLRNRPTRRVSSSMSHLRPTGPSGRYLRYESRACGRGKPKWADSRYRASPTEVHRNQSGQSAKRKWECKIGEGRCFSWIKLGGPGQCKHFLLQNMKENSHNGVRKIDQELAQERKDALKNGGRTPRCFASNSESDSNIDCPRFSLPRTVIGKGGDCKTES